MENAVQVVQAGDVPVEHMQEAHGWAISEFRLPISGRNGSSTTMFHSVFRAGSAHARHVHHRCDEFVAYVNGRGVVGGGPGRADVTAGYRRRIPQDSVHFFSNSSDTEEALVIGFYVGAGSVEDSGYELCGMVTPADVQPPFRAIEEGTLVTVDDTPVSDLTGVPAWLQAEVRLSVGTHTGSPNGLLDATLPPGARIEPHRMTNAEQLYFVVAGEGAVESGPQRLPIRAGSVIFVPVGTELAVDNADGAEHLWFLGVLTGAGSLAEAGCTAG